MADDRNTLAWPSIDQLPRVTADRINRFFAVADIAAIIIQRAHRGVRPNGQGDLRGGKRSRLRELLLGSTCTVGTKFDGTNVGATSDGTLLGRRLVIENSATSYQRCELRTLRSYNVAGALDELIALGGTGTSVKRSAIYGELCCNVGLYDYRAAGIAKAWLAFGALLEFEDEAAASEYIATASATASGLLCNFEASNVRVCNTAAFSDAMRRHGIPVVSISEHTSLCAAVAAHQEWMTGEHGEGLVITVARGRRADGKASTYKWKISREPQPAAVSLLTDLAAELADGAGGKARLLDPEIHQMISSLLAVATYVDSTTVAKGNGVSGSGNSKASKKPAKANAADAAAVARALASALSKFDDVATYLDTHGAAGVPALIERLVTEMVSDAELQEGLPAEEATNERVAALKEVATAVKKHVGQELGAWKKARAASS